jgi:hypothetical protein
VALVSPLSGAWHASHANVSELLISRIFIAFPPFLRLRMNNGHDQLMLARDDDLGASAHP